MKRLKRPSTCAVCSKPIERATDRLYTDGRPHHYDCDPPEPEDAPDRLEPLVGDISGGIASGFLSPVSLRNESPLPGDL